MCLRLIVHLYYDMLDISLLFVSFSPAFIVVFTIVDFVDINRYSTITATPFDNKLCSTRSSS